MPKTHLKVIPAPSDVEVSARPTMSPPPVLTYDTEEVVTYRIEGHTYVHITGGPEGRMRLVDPVNGTELTGPDGRPLLRSEVDRMIVSKTAVRSFDAGTSFRSTLFRMACNDLYLSAEKVSMKVTSSRPDRASKGTPLRRRTRRAQRVRKDRR